MAWRPESAGGVLRWGMRTIVALIVAGAIVSVWLIVSVQQRVIEGFKERERTTFLIGATTQQLFLLRISVRQMLQDETGRGQSEAEQAQAEIRKDLDELFALGLGETARQKLEINALAEALFAANQQVFRAHAAGNLDEALNIQNATLSESARLVEHLNELPRLGGTRLREELDSANLLFNLLIGVDSFIALLLVAATLFVWRGQNLQIVAGRVKIQEQVRMLKLANEELDAFAGRIAHDFKNLLTPILLSAESLELGQNEQDAIKTGKRIRRSCEQALRLSNALLAFARASHQKDARQEASVESEAEAVRTELLAEPENIAAEINLSVDRAPPVYCTPELLFLMLYNLVGNAIKFARPVVDPVVTIEASRHGQWVEISVADNGPGISPHALPHIFQPFYREAGIKPTGTGMGLPTVRRIAESFGGTVEVSSKVGLGTVFRLRLRAAEVNSHTAT